MVSSENIGALKDSPKHTPTKVQFELPTTPRSFCCKVCSVQTSTVYEAGTCSLTPRCAPKWVEVIFFARFTMTKLPRRRQICLPLKNISSRGWFVSSHLPTALECYVSLNQQAAQHGSSEFQPLVVVFFLQFQGAKVKIESRHTW